MENTRNLSCPVVHLNGSGFENLKNQYHAAYVAIQEAEEVLRGSAPHSRDFYVLENGPERFAAASAEHVERLTKLRIIQDELVQLVESLYDQQSARKK